jgi:hypothetical protein
MRKKRISPRLTAMGDSYEAFHNLCVLSQSDSIAMLWNLSSFISALSHVRVVLLSEHDATYAQIMVGLLSSRSSSLVLIYFARIKWMILSNRFV